MNGVGNVDKGAICLYNKQWCPSELPAPSVKWNVVGYTVGGLTQQTRHPLTGMVVVSTRQWINVGGKMLT